MGAAHSQGGVHHPAGPGPPAQVNLLPLLTKLHRKQKELYLSSRGTVTLNSTDPAAPPVIQPNYFTHPLDIKVVEVHRRCTDLTCCSGWWLE